MHKTADLRSENERVYRSHPCHSRAVYSVVSGRQQVCEALVKSSGFPSHASSGGKDDLRE